MEYLTHTLRCGLRVICLGTASPVVYCGYSVRAGARDEGPLEEGLAHFCEHVTFKGTARRSPMQVLNCLERVGGDLNAFTGKEGTVFHAAVLREHLPLAVDLLTDIVFHSAYPEREVEREVEVIRDEIQSYLDSPSELIYDVFEREAFRGHPLGHNILGREESLGTFSGEDARRFTSRHYRPSNAVFFAYGDVGFDRLVRLLERATGDFPAAAPAMGRDAGTGIPAYVPKELTLDRNTNQAHVMIGNRGFGMHDGRRFALSLLSNMVGGPGMNARLNVILRERHGLVYTVESSTVCYSDTGLWCVYFGCDHKDVPRCLRLVRRDLARLMETPLSPARLQAAKRQMKGQMAIASDNREGFALSLGKAFLNYGKGRNLDAIFRAIDGVSAEDVQSVAQAVFDPDTVTTLVIS